MLAQTLYSMLSGGGVHGEKKWGIWEAHSREILICGGKFLNFGGNFAFLYIKTQFKLGKIGLASREINILSSCGGVCVCVMSDF